MSTSKIIDVGRLTYTPDGIQRLSKVIQASLRVRGWTERELARVIASNAAQSGGNQFSAATINRYAKGRTAIPSDNVYQAVAPYMYKVIAIRGDQIELDTSSTYEGEEWRDFARLGTTDYRP